MTKIVGEGCVSFYDEEGKVGVNLVPFADVPFVRAPGDHVSLPGGEGYGAGVYVVTMVYHSYVEGVKSEDPGASPVYLLSITVHVKKVSK